jgi:Fic family protein
MLRPQFRYSHSLVAKLLQIEAARAWLEALGAHPGGTNGRLPAADRIVRESDECPTEETLLQLQGALEGKTPEFRQDSGIVYNQSRTELIYIPPEPQDVPDLVADLLDWLAASWSQAPAAVLAGVVEEGLLLVQPFANHNGRLARLAGDAVLARKGYPFVASVRKWLSGHAAEYARASNAVHSGVFTEQADLSHWLDYYVGAIAQGAETARAELAGQPGPALPAPALNPEAESGGPAILRERQVRALKHMLENGAIRSGEYQKLAGIVPDTARRDFDGLMAQGLIEVRGVGRGTYYVLTARGAEQAERRRIS